MEDEEYNLLQEEFALYPDRVKFSITLTNRRIRITRAGNTKNEDNVMLDDVTGCHVLQASKESISSAYLCVFSYPLKKKKIGSGVIRQKVTKTFTINTNQTYQENLVIAEMWKMTIKRLVAGEVIKTKEDIENGALATRNLLVLVNPFSGRKKATALYKEKVKPMFLEAEIKHTVRKTEYAGHAKEIAQSLKLEDWDGIVIVSGDGLIHEVINGLMDRPDWEKAIQMPIGVVPGGSGNALAAAIVFASTGYHDVARSATLCTFEICRGLTRPLDILAVETKVPGGVTNATFGDGQSQRNICYSFMGISVGLIADIDIESESIRCLGGELRIAIYSAIRVLFLRKYDLEVSYASCCTHQDESIDTANNDIPNGSGDTGTSHGKWTPLTIPALEKEVPKNWVTVQDNFVLVLANLITHLATNMLAYKNADLDNGKIMLTLDGHNFKRRDCMKAYDLMSSGRGVQDWVNPNQYSSENIECTAFRVIPKERPHSLTVDECNEATSNDVIWQIVSNNFELDTIFEILKGKSRKMSLAAIETEAGQKYYSFLNFAWGFIADVDIESERFRKLGPVRFAIGCAIRVAKMRLYHGRISYLPAIKNAYSYGRSHSYVDAATNKNGSQDSARNKHSSISYDRRSFFGRSISRHSVREDAIHPDVDLINATTSRNGDDVFENGESGSQNMDNGTESRDSSTTPISTSHEGGEEGAACSSADVTDVESHQVNQNNDGDETNADHIGQGDGTESIEKLDYPAELAIATRPVEVPNDDVPAAWKDSAIVYHLRASCDEPAPDDWAVVESEFVWVTSVYLSHIGYEMMGVPKAQLDEDVLYIYTLRRGISKAQMVSVLLGFENGTHIEKGGEFSCVIPCRAVRLEPLNFITGHMTVDGELAPHCSIQASITPHKVNIMSSVSD